MAKKTRPRAIVGSSLGALVALEVAARGVDAPLVLIAPALGIAERWEKKIPPGDPVMVFNHARGHDAPIHRAFFDQIAKVRSDVSPPRSRVVVIMGRNDETVPFQRVSDVWTEWERSGKLAPGSRFIEISDGDHGLTASANLISDEIRKAVR
jgi:pimeloyl-ACP methyl ester carboxylesterase